jgi:hydroxymethylglutaryl-CoA reductase
MKNVKSRIPEFRKWTPADRRKFISDLVELNDREEHLIGDNGSLRDEYSQRMVENYFMNIEIPVGIATNFMINNKEYLIPMAIEEPSVIAACSNAARIARIKGGFTAISSDNIMYGQIQITDLVSPEAARISILKRKMDILNIANTVSHTLKERGKGAIDLEIRDLPYKKGLIIHLKVDVLDAMGANVINAMVERVSPFVEELTGGNVILKILSNLSPERITRVTAVFDKDAMGGERVTKRFIDAYEMARTDIYRATTHNKGIMNGIDAVLLATLNDWRQAEANAHAYASISGHYTSLTKYSLDDEGNVVGSIEIPIALGTVGGATSVVEKAKINMKILNVNSAKEFQEVVASVGLAQNFAAVRALSDEGIQRGHMKLHSRNIAIAAGASGDLIDIISDKMISEGKISYSYAGELLRELGK